MKWTIGRSCVLLTLLATAAAAQTWRGAETVAVQVNDSKGRSVPDARVVFTFQGVPGQTGPDVVATGSNGRAVLADLAPGPWQVEISHPDFLSYIAMVDVRRGKKPLVSASFLEASGRSLAPVKVKFSKGDPNQASPALEARRTTPPSEPAPPRVAESPEPSATEAPAAMTPSRPEPSRPTTEASEPEMPVATPDPTPDVSPVPETVAAAPTPAPEIDVAAEPAEAVVEPPAGEPAPAPAVPPLAETATADEPQPAPEPIAAAPGEAPAPSKAPEGEAPPPPTPERLAEPVAEPTVSAPESPQPAAAPTPDTPSVAPTAEPAAVPSPTPAAPVTPPTPEPTESTPRADLDVPVEPPVEEPTVAEVAPAEPVVDEPAAEPPATPPVSAPVPPPLTPAAAAAALPPPTDPGAFVTSHSGGTCADCASAEWTLQVGAPVPARAPDSAGRCGAEVLEAAQDAMRGLSTSIQLELDGFIGPLANGSAQAALAHAEADLVAPFSAELAPYVGGESPCQIVGLVLPKEVRFSRLRLAAGDLEATANCSPGQPCPIGDALWLGSVLVERGPSATVVYGLFENRSTERGRRAIMVAYYRPPNANWKARLPAEE